jgi:hypothetical protein
VIDGNQKWAQEAVDLFDEYGTLSEFNGGTYAGVTLFAMSLAQYLPTNTTLYKHAPRLMSAIWDQVGESEWRPHRIRLIPLAQRKRIIPP